MIGSYELVRAGGGGRGRGEWGEGEGNTYWKGEGGKGPGGRVGRELSVERFRGRWLGMEGKREMKGERKGNGEGKEK